MTTQKDAIYQPLTLLITIHLTTQTAGQLICSAHSNTLTFKYVPMPLYLIIHCEWKSTDCYGSKP